MPERLPGGHGAGTRILWRIRSACNKNGRPRVDRELRKTMRALPNDTQACVCLQFTGASETPFRDHRTQYLVAHPSAVSGPTNLECSGYPSLRITARSLQPRTSSHCTPGRFVRCVACLLLNMAAVTSSTSMLRKDRAKHGP